MGDRISTTVNNVEQILPNHDGLEEALELLLTSIADDFKAIGNAIEAYLAALNLHSDDVS